MRFKSTSSILLALILAAACTTKSKTDAARQQEQPPAPVVADPTPPVPPDSAEVPADIQHMPTFLLMAVGGLASEGEKEGIKVQENIRLFETDADTPAIVSFYAREMKDRGWTTDSQVARSAKVGVTMQEYRRTSAKEALYLIISEPEHGEIPDRADDKRHVALVPAKLK